MSAIVVNGRFMHQRVTGVQRYAREVTRRLADITVIEPRRAASGLRGHLWEQFVLPRKARHCLLWSPCNAGPVSLERQVITIHDCAFADLPEYYSENYVRWYRWMTPRLLRKCRRIITVSEFSRQRIVEFGRIEPEKVSVIPNGVTPFWEQLTPDRVAEVRSRLKLPERYVLSVGSLEPRKNIKRLIEAWAQVPAKDGSELVIVGSSCRVFQDPGLNGAEGSVRMLGYVSDDDLPAVYAGASVFVYPSLYEGFGLPVLEAMACGTPVICSNRTALPEVAGDAAILVDPESVQEMASAIGMLLADETRQATLRQAGIKRAQEYSWDRTAAQVWQVLRSMVDGVSDS